MCITFHIKTWLMHTCIPTTTLLALCSSDMIQHSNSHLQGIWQIQFHTKINKICTRCEIQFSEQCLLYYRTVHHFIWTVISVQGNKQDKMAITVLTIKQLDALISQIYLKWNSACFGQFLCPSSGVFHCTHSYGICHTGLLTACKQNQHGIGLVLLLAHN